MSFPKNKNLNRRRIASGFTLIELLVVISIIAVLVGLLTAGVMAATNASRRATTQMRIGKVAMLLEDFNERWDSYPPVYTRTTQDANPASQWINNFSTSGDTDNDNVYLKRNRKMMELLMVVPEFRSEIEGFADTALNTNAYDSSGEVVEEGDEAGKPIFFELLDGFDQPIRFDGSISSVDAAKVNDDRRTKSVRIGYGNLYNGNYTNFKYGKFVVWSTGLR